MTGCRVWIGLSLALAAVGCGTPPKEYFYTLTDYTLGDYTLGDVATGDAAAADYRIAIDVQRFESTLGERVTIEALWSVRAAQGRRARTGRSFVSEPARGADHEALAAAHGRALAQMAAELAGAIRLLRSTRPLPWAAGKHLTSRSRPRRSAPPADAASIASAIRRCRDRRWTRAIG